MPFDARLRIAAHSLALLLMTGWLLHWGRPILVPVVTAVLIVFVILGLADLLKRLPRFGAMPARARELIAAVVIGAALAELFGLVMANVAAFSERASSYQDAMLALHRRVALNLGVDEADALRALRAEAAQAMNLPALARSTLVSAASLVGVSAFVLLNAVFLMTERRSFAAKLDRLGLSPATTTRLRAVAADVHDRIAVYLATKTVINIALGVVSWAILRAFGVEFAALFAIVIGLLNYIPYFGSFIGVAFPVAAALLTFPEVEAVFWLALWLAGAQIVVGNVLEPQIMGATLNLSPWVILIALTFWGGLWGVAGAVVAAPLTAVIVVLLSEFATTRPLAILLSRDGSLPGQRAETAG